MQYKTLHDIRARVTARWKNPRCKFKRGDQAQVNAKVLQADAWVSAKKQRKCGSAGTVIAVSCLKDGRIRNNGDNGRRVAAPLRQFTKYYVQFEDQILGYESHHLDLVWSQVALHDKTHYNTIMEQQQLLQAIKLLITHLNDSTTESTAPVEAGLMELRDLLWSNKSPDPPEHTTINPIQCTQY
jgi:hypothetical protein